MFTFPTTLLGVSSSATTPNTIAVANGETCELWLDAAFGVTEGATFEWLDRSGNNRHATQATEANQPAYQATGFLSSPAVLWDSDLVRMLTLASALPNGPYTAWIIGAADAGGNRRLLQSTGATHYLGTSTSEAPSMNTGGSSLNHSVAGAANDPTFFRYAWTASGIQRVSHQGQTEQIAAAGSNSSAMSNLGSVAGGSAGHRGPVAGIIHVTGNHAEGSDLVVAMEAYILSRWPTL